MLIADAEDLQALPVGTVVLDSTGHRWIKNDDDPRQDDGGPVLPAITLPGLRRVSA